MLELATVTLASLFAGFVDAIVGGGGLILVPALFSVYPGAPPATLLGTNKGASVWGTAWATTQFARRVDMPWRPLLPAAAAALAGSFTGAWAVTLISAGGLRRALPFILLGVLLYTLAKKDLGRHHAPRHEAATQTLIASVIGLTIGFYDGFFGPGTGTFFSTSLVALRGYGLTKATALTKLFNFSSNVASVLLFALGGHMLWLLGLCMAVGAMIGGWLGSHSALKFGARLIRPLLVAISLALTAKLLWGYFSGQVR